MHDVIDIRAGEGVLDIFLTDPEGGNLISNEAGERIIAALAGLDPAVRLVRISSSGATFCLGRVSPPLFSVFS